MAGLVTTLCILGLLCISGIQANDESNGSMYKWPLPTILQQLMESYLEPVLNFIEPYKVSSSTNERGLPVTHDKLGKLQP